MTHRNCKVHLPKDLNLVKQIFDDAIKVSFKYWVDEKGTLKNPSVWKRELSDLNVEEAWNIIKMNKPHNVIYFRDMEYLNDEEINYYDFGTCNISSNVYGEIFIFINVYVKEAQEIIKKYNLKEEWY